MIVNKHPIQTTLAKYLTGDKLNAKENTITGGENLESKSVLFVHKHNLQTMKHQKFKFQTFIKKNDFSETETRTIQKYNPTFKQNPFTRRSKRY